MRRHWRLRIITLALLVMSLSVEGVRAAPSPGEFVATGYAPATDGTTVVWISSEDPAGVYAMREGDHEPFLVYAPPPQIGIDKVGISGDLVVWQQYGGDGIPAVRGKNLATGHEFDVAITESFEYLHGIFGTTVLWQEAQGASTPLKARDLATMAPPVTIRTIPADRLLLDAAIWEDRVAWVERENYERGLIYVATIGDEPILVQEGIAFGLGGLDLVENLLVYTMSDARVVVHDLVTEQSQVLFVGDQVSVRNPRTNGRYIFVDTSGCHGYRCSVREFVGYDRETDSRFTVPTGNTLTELVLMARGDMLVWGQWGGVWGAGGSESSAVPEIHAVPISSVLPSAPRPAPSDSSTAWRYFPETGHYLSNGFKEYWEESGGLPVFGFPLTEEFSQIQVNPFTIRTVQYLERQRFEYHPEHAGTPYEVELGRLGAEDAARRGLLDNLAFAPLPGDTPSDANCTFFPQTGHRLCFGFKEYWESHGLEFGDPGVSYRESLALFGYPISEEFTYPDTGLTVQYFERARFEFHPDNPEPHRVLLGRLGADLVTARGW